MSAPQTLPLVSITAWSSGGTPSRSNDAYWNGRIPWISAATLKGSRIAGSDQHLTEAGLRAGSNLAPKGATLVLVRGMALHRETRIGLAQLPVSFNQDVKALVPKAGILPEFLLYALQARSSQIRELVSSAGSGTGVLNTQLLQRLPIWVPSQETQRTVVQAMSDVDDLIATRERLIVKKQLMKQGMMQQLLTGRTRLPGFSLPWTQVHLGDVGESLIGLTYSPANVQRSGTLVLRSSNIQDGQLSFDDNVFVDSPIPSRIRVRENDILICVRNGSRGLIGKSVMLDRRVVGQTFGAFMAVYRSQLNPFLQYFFQSDRFKRQIDEHLGATINQITNASLNGFVADMPDDPAEQAAIGGVLADTEFEIAILQARLDKARDIKTGMMQQLLIGRTRLPVEAAS